jgi:hypothetical protein
MLNLGELWEAWEVVISDGTVTAKVCCLPPNTFGMCGYVAGQNRKTASRFKLETIYSWITRRFYSGNVKGGITLRSPEGGSCYLVVIAFFIG